MAFVMPKVDWTKWWNWIPVVGPVLFLIDIAEAIDTSIQAPMADAIDEAAATQEAGVTAASDAITTATDTAVADVTTATDTAVTGVEDAVTTATEGVAEATAAAQEAISPYSEAGSAALSRMRILMGLDGADAQAAAYTQIAQGPEMTELSRQGENAILQGASATGGLRGGNTQGALAQFRPQLLSNLINQQYQNLSGIANQGYNAAAQGGNYGMQGALGAGQFGVSGATAAGNFGQQGAIAGGNYGMQGAMTQGSLAQALAAIQSGQTLSQAQLAAQSPTWDFMTQLAGAAIGASF